LSFERSSLSVVCIFRLLLFALCHLPRFVPCNPDGLPTGYVFFADSSRHTTLSAQKTGPSVQTR
jgi:hypothetical protein